MNDPTRSLKLEGLQDLLIDEFIGKIKEGEAPPALLNAARQLLKDNNITSAITMDSPLQNLVSLLPFEDPSDKVVGLDD
jgi:hypothetical protein|tara:strand:+ start:877 stop:1113 length:237 start_codon:yes stop_codon:yes gene_type:complete